jgi:hypothetical protein
MFIAVAISSSAVVASSNDPLPELLFVQSASGVVFKDSKPATLILKNVSPTVIFFADRPQRVAGHVAMPGFLKAWNESSESFSDDPPNANLSIVGDGKVTNVVVELLNPQYDGSDLTYDVTVLEGELPATAGTTALFIDGLFSGGMVASGGRGAALGAVGGAIAGDAGKGAAIGAAVGAAGSIIGE